MPNNQQQIQLARRPKGVPAHDDFRFETIAVPEPKDGEVLVKTSYVPSFGSGTAIVSKRKSSWAGTPLGRLAN